MFTFPIAGVRKVIERGKLDAAANGGFRNPYYGTRPGEGEKKVSSGVCIYVVPPSR